MRGLKDFLEAGKKFKKSDWLLVALFGVLLLVIAIPSGGRKEKNAAVAVQTEENVTSGRDALKEQQAYVTSLEKKLESVLKEMEGIGDVKVMIMAKDTGERLVEKDTNREAKTTADVDEEGIGRTVTESVSGAVTVYVEDGTGRYPYIQSEKLPEIGGVVVVAKGADDAKTATRITEAVTALFAVEVHRVRVLPMK